MQQGSSESLKERQDQRSKVWTWQWELSKEEETERQGEDGKPKASGKPVWGSVERTRVTGRRFQWALLPQGPQRSAHRSHTQTSLDRLLVASRWHCRTPRERKGMLLERVPVVEYTQDSHSRYCSRQSLGPGFLIAHGWSWYLRLLFP